MNSRELQLKLEDILLAHRFESSRVWPDGTPPTAPDWNPGCSCGEGMYYFEHQEHLAKLQAALFREFTVKQLEEVANTIEAELICCDVYERNHETTGKVEGHAICYWSSASRQIALDQIKKLS